MIFGPVPSRRLGNSLGVNNIPPKECSYTCIYCQLGNTLKLEINRKEYYSTSKIVSEIEQHLSRLGKKEIIDYITFVPDGEPTLDINLGKTIEACKKFGIKIAVITNASLVWDEDVQDSLCKADWVSLKVDTVDELLWHKIDRPHGNLKLDDILEGIKTFSKKYKNDLVTETMLIKDVNDNVSILKNTANFIKSIKPKISYITIPTRPPAVSGIDQPSIYKINEAYKIFSKTGLITELITGYEGNEFSSTGNFKEDLLSITAVHPMRKDAVEELVKKDNANWENVIQLTEDGEIIETIHNNEIYYLRNLRNWRKSI